MRIVRPLYRLTTVRTTATFIIRKCLRKGERFLIPEARLVIHFVINHEIFRPNLQFALTANLLTFLVIKKSF